MFGCRLVIVIAALTACGGAVAAQPPYDGGTPFPATDYASGSRLRAQTYRTTEGAAIFHGWFDSKLNVACSFAIADDGVLRCLPISAGYEVVYSDSACQTPVALLDHNATDPPGLRYAMVQSCAGNSVFLGSAAPSAPLASIYVTSSDAPCGVGKDDFPTFSIVQRVDASTFVGAKMIATAVDDSLAARVLVADDGARVTTSAFDVAHGDACDLGDPTTNTNSICAPSITAAPFPSCAQDSIVAGVCPNAVPSALRQQNSCVATAATAVALAASCFPGDATVAVGEAFDAPHLAQVDRGTSRLRVRWVTSAAGSPIRVAGFFDSLLDTPCHAELHDGFLCVPDAPLATAFIDGCIEPAVFSDCSAPRFAELELPPRYYARGAPLEIGAPLCVAGEGCICHASDGTENAFHSTPLTDDAFASLDDVTE